MSAPSWTRSRRRRALVIAGCVVVFIAVPERLVLEHMSSQLHEAAALTAERSALQATIRAGSAAKVERASLEAEARRAERALPPQPKGPGAVGFVEQAAHLAGVTLVSVSSALGAPSASGASVSSSGNAPTSWAGADAGRVGTITLEISVEGDTSGLERFVTSLAGGNRLVVVGGLSLTQAQGQGGLYDLSVEADAFYLEGAGAPVPTSSSPGGAQ